MRGRPWPSLVEAMLQPPKISNSQPAAAGRSSPLKALQGALLIGAGTLMLAWPAFYNDYPLLWFDTCSYLLTAWDIPVREMRSPFYSLASAPSLALASAWPIAIA